YQADALAVQAQDPAGHELWTQVWSLPHAADFRALTTAPGAGKVEATETADSIRVQSGNLTVTISKQTGQLASVQRGGQAFSLTNGPRLAVGEGTLASIEQRMDGADCVVSATYTGDLKSVRWRIRPNGWVQMDYAYALSGPQDFFGVSFDYPEANVKSLKWLGDGPYRTWKNRRAGGVLNVWQTAYNNTITGDSLWQYPEFKGYYGGVRWAQLGTTEGPITMALGRDSDFVQVFTPATVPPKQQGNTQVAFSEASLSFLQAIPAMGSKFAKANTTGPQGQQTVADGDYQGSVNFYFGEFSR
ncbi:MAG: beta-galactosidase small subunit, partial [Armatimonadota bacterium]|nr:beta-galactosidase small subunit [Armatimonadota bacterium]